jgi:hypothetical protein
MTSRIRAIVRRTRQCLSLGRPRSWRLNERIDQTRRRRELAWSISQVPGAMRAPIVDTGPLVAFLDRV